MINELYELSKVLHNEDIKTQSWHRKYQPIPNIRSNAPCVCIKVSAGKVIGISSVDAELGKILRKYGSNQGSYPCMNLAPLYRITDDTKKKKIADLGNHPEKIDDACIAEMRAWCTENTYNWSKKFQGKYKISMEKTPMELHCIATQYEPLKILLDETNFFATASGLHKELERTAWELLERKDQTSLALSVLFYQGKKDKSAEDDYGSLSVAFDLLQQASQRNSRRIFVVLPYTSIIQQSVDIYRKALVLPEENPEEVVAELHSRADFQDFDTRYLTSLWRAPIIVTTAVAFFETLSSCQPSALRRLHELPGSVIFVDEAHNALPIKLLPLAWRWLNVLADEWSCYWVLASGSLVCYWELDRLKEIGMAQPKVTELVRYDLRNQLMAYEQNRIAFLNKESPVSRRDLIEWVANSPGPRLLILNTVQSAAVIASDMAQKYGRGCVEHLSTALTPEDRSKTIKRIKQRLKDTSDRDWTLVATSCVEAGVDFSFRTGFREMSSLLSLLQAAGRVNRHGQLKDAEMWSFSLQDDSMLSQNKSLECSADVLKDYFARKIPITPELSTRSMHDEIIRDDSCIKTIKQLMEQENVMQFRTVDREFEVIDADTIPAVVNLSLAEEIAHGRSDWKTLQRQSVSIRRDKIKRWNLKEIAPGVYRWTLGYNDFLGYMSGVINTGKTIFC